MAYCLACGRITSVTRGGMCEQCSADREVFRHDARVIDGRGRGMSRNDRNGHRRRILRARVKAMGLPCALCGQPIDYDLPALDPMSYELDEIVPVSLGGSELDPDNVQPSHRICNQRKGNKLFYVAEPPTEEGDEKPPSSSQDWTA